MADCEQVQQRLYSCISGEILDADKRAIEAHIALCPACAKEFARMREVFAISGLAGVPQLPPLPFVNVQRRIERAKIHRLQLVGLVAAASVLAGLTLVLLWAFFSESPAPVAVTARRQSQQPAQREEMREGAQLVSSPQQLTEQEVKPVAEGEDIEKTPSKTDRESVTENEQQEEKRVEEPEQVVERPQEKALEGQERRPGEPEDGEVSEAASLAVIGDLNGEVEVIRKGEKLKGVVLLSIESGDTVKTNSLGRVRIDFSEKTQLFVNNSAEVEIFEQVDSSIFVKLAKGEVYACTDEGRSVKVEVGFSQVECEGGAFNLERVGERAHLLSVISGSVQCHCKGCSKEYLEGMRAWLRDDGKFEKGSRLRSEEAVRWTERLGAPCRRLPRHHREVSGEEGSREREKEPPGGMPKRPNGEGEKGKMPPRGEQPNPPSQPEPQQPDTTPEQGHPGGCPEGQGGQQSGNRNGCPKRNK